MIQIAISPLRIRKSQSKDLILNLNVVRNTHYRTLNTAKKNYTTHMGEQLRHFKGILRARLLFIIYPKTRRKFDLDNVGSIHAKFFQDALVKHGIIPDDDYEHITEVTFRYGEVDKHNPRVEIAVISPDEEPTLITKE